MKTSNSLGLSVRPKPGNPTPAISRFQAWQTASPAVFLGSHLAEHYTRDAGKALEVADRLKATGLRPNIVRSGPNYVAYIATTDLLRLAERDETVRKAIALYLAEKAKNGTPRQREIAEKILKRHPFLNPGLPLLQN